MNKMTLEHARAVWSQICEKEPKLARRIIRMQSATWNRMREDLPNDEDFGPVMASYGFSNTMATYKQLMHASMEKGAPRPKS